MYKLIITLIILIFFSMPIAFSLGLGTYIYAWLTGEPTTTLLIQRMIAGVNSFPMLALPLFLLMGELMTRGGAMSRLMKLPNVLFGHITGGLGLVSIGTSVLFGGISGSAVGDVAAVGAIMGPEMKKRGFKPGFIAALQGSAGTLASVIPPSIVLILIGVSGGLSIGDLFLAGIVPGILTALAMMFYVYFYAKKNKLFGDERKNWADVKEAITKSIIPLGMPVIVLGGILTGVFTATESAAVAVLYAFLLGIFVYRELSFEDLKKSLHSSVVNSAIIMILLATSSAFAWILSENKSAEKLTDLFLLISSNPVMIFIMMMLLLLALGIILEAVPIVLLMTPILMPIAIDIGMDPIHFGILMAMNLAISSNTPPMAVTLVTACRVINVKVEETFPDILYILGIMGFITIILALFPEITLFLPSLND